MKVQNSPFVLTQLHIFSDKFNAYQIFRGFIVNMLY